MGAIARLLVPGDQNLSVLATLMLGLIGSVTGGVVANALGTGTGTGDIFELNVIGAIVAFGSAALLIVAVEKSGIGGQHRAP